MILRKGDGFSIAFFINTNALNEMLKRVQHDKKKYVIPNLFRNLEFGNDNELIAFVLVHLALTTINLKSTNIFLEYLFFFESLNSFRLIFIIVYFMLQDSNPGIDRNTSSLSRRRYSPEAFLLQKLIIYDFFKYAAFPFILL